MVQLPIPNLNGIPATPAASLPEAEVSSHPSKDWIKLHTDTEAPWLSPGLSDATGLCGTIVLDDRPIHNVFPSILTCPEGKIKGHHVRYTVQK